MSLTVAIYLGGVGVFSAILAALMLRDRGEADFWAAILLAVAWPISIIAIAAMVITRLAEKEKS